MGAPIRWPPLPRSGPDWRPALRKELAWLPAANLMALVLLRALFFR